jgi:hypothetical protein
MRITLAHLALLIAVIWASRVALAEGGRRAEPGPKPRYIVFHRWINERGDDLRGAMLSLCDGEKGSVTLLRSQSPFVTGVTPVTDRKTEANAQQPSITVIDEGLKIDLVIAARQRHGATVDVTVEETKITGVDVKSCSPNTTLQSPRVETRKRRVIDFVRFDNVLVVPMGEKRPDGTTPRVEILIGAGEIIRYNLPSHGGDLPRIPVAAEREAIFRAVLATGAARVFCVKESRWAAFRGRTLFDELSPLGELCDLAGYCPCASGLANVLRVLSPLVNDPDRVQRIEEALVGCSPGYCIDLGDSPSLMRSLELLSRLPSLSSVTIHANKVDDRLRQAVKKLRAQHVEIVPMSGDLSAWWGSVETHDNLEGSTHERVKTVSVPVQRAESSLASLKALPNLQQVLIQATGNKDEAEAKRLLAVFKPALPNAEIHVLLFAEPAG